MPVDPLEPPKFRHIKVGRDGTWGWEARGWRGAGVPHGAGQGEACCTRQLSRLHVQQVALLPSPAISAACGPPANSSCANSISTAALAGAARRGLPAGARHALAAAAADGEGPAGLEDPALHLQLEEQQGAGGRRMAGWQQADGRQCSCSCGIVFRPHVCPSSSPFPARSLHRHPPARPTQGYTIPLDKRLAADGRGLQEVAINDQFAKVGPAALGMGWLAGREPACRARALLCCCFKVCIGQQPAVQLACPFVSVRRSLLALHHLPPRPPPPPCSSLRRCTSQSRRLGRRWRRAPRCSASCWPARRWAAGWGGWGAGLVRSSSCCRRPATACSPSFNSLAYYFLSHHASIPLLPHRRSARSGSCASWPSRRAWTGWVARPPRQVRMGVVLCL